jgi:hypothetical protein
MRMMVVVAAVEKSTRKKEKKIRIWNDRMCNIKMPEKSP